MNKKAITIAAVLLAVILSSIAYIIYDNIRFHTNMKNEILEIQREAVKHKLKGPSNIIEKDKSITYSQNTNQSSEEVDPSALKLMEEQASQIAATQNYDKEQKSKDEIPTLTSMQSIKDEGKQPLSVTTSPLQPKDSSSQYTTKIFTVKSGEIIYYEVKSGILTKIGFNGIINDRLNFIEYCGPFINENQKTSMISVNAPGVRVFELENILNPLLIGENVNMLIKSVDKKNNAISVQIRPYSDNN